MFLATVTVNKDEYIYINAYIEGRRSIPCTCVGVNITLHNTHFALTVITISRFRELVPYINNKL